MVNSERKLYKKVLVRFKKFINRFLGPDDIEYGPFEEGQEVELPEQVVKYLEKTQPDLIEVISSEPEQIQQPTTSINDLFRSFEASFVPVIFLQDYKFKITSGKTGQTYGPFKAGDHVLLPTDIALGLENNNIVYIESRKFDLLHVYKGLFYGDSIGVKLYRSGVREILPDEEASAFPSNVLYVELSSEEGFVEAVDLPPEALKEGINSNKKKIIPWSLVDFGMAEDFFYKYTKRPPEYFLTFRSPEGHEVTVSGTVPQIVEKLREFGLIIYPTNADKKIMAYLSAIFLKARRFNYGKFKRSVILPEGFILKDGKYWSNDPKPRPLTKKQKEKILHTFDFGLHSVILGYGTDESSYKRLVIFSWFAVAPLHISAKLNGKRLWLPYLLLTGYPRTGKTTISELFLYMWNPEHTYPGTGANTQPRLGELLQMTTYPILINEALPVLHNESLFDMIKHANESVISRIRLIKGGEEQKRYVACSPLVFTTNKFDLRDRALLRRVFPINFTKEEVIPNDRTAEEIFNREIFPTVSEGLKYFGKAFRYYAWKTYRKEGKNMFERPWYDLAFDFINQLLNDINYDTLENQLVRELMEGREPIDIMREFMEDSTELNTIEEIVSLLTKQISRHLGSTNRVDLSTDFEDALVKGYFVPYIYYKEDTEEVLITYSLIKKLSTVSTLKEFGDLFGWDYSVRRISGKNVKVVATNVSTFKKKIFGVMGDE